MANNTELIRSEKGQSIVIIAIVMVGMLALAGLAIDGGNLFLQRRRVQNASDAGAMAGTRVLALIISECGSGNGADDARVAEAVADFVADNGFNAADGSKIAGWYLNKNASRLGQVGAGSIPMSSTGVEVEVEADIDTYFIRVVGIRSATVGADAAALTGPITQLTGGVLPIAVPLEVVEEMEADEDFVVMENDQHKGGMFCEDSNGNGQYDEGFDLCIGDPSSHNAHRGWLNLNYIYNLDYVEPDAPFYRTFEPEVPNRGCGPDAHISTDDGVQGWASGDCPYPFPIYSGTVDQIDGDFIHGSPGARQASLAEVVETYNGRIGYIPIFDHIYMSDYMDEWDEYFPDPDVGWPRAGGGGSAFLYHIVGYTAVKINDGHPHDHELAGAFQSATVGLGQINPGAGLGSGECQPLMLHGINLWR